MYRKHVMNTGKDFLRRIPVTEKVRPMTEQWESMRWKFFFIEIETVNWVRRLSKGKKVFATYDRGLISRIYKEFKRLNSNKQPNKIKWDNDLSRESQMDLKRTINTRQNILNHQPSVKCNLKQLGFTLIPSDVLHKQTQTQSNSKAWGGCEKGGTLNHCWCKCELV